MNEVKLLDTVALLKDVPEYGLVKGQVGVAVEELASNVFEIEFCNVQGETLAMLPIESEFLMILHYDSVAA